MTRSRSKVAFIPGAVLAIGASALMAGGMPRVVQPPVRAKLGDLTSAGISQFEAFAPLLPSGAPATFTVAVALGGRTVTLSVAKWSNRGDGFQVLVDRGNGLLERVADPELRTYSG